MVKKIKQLLLLIVSLVFVGNMVSMQEKVTTIDKSLLTKSPAEIARWITNDPCQMDFVMFSIQLNTMRKSIPDEKDWEIYVENHIFEIDKCISEVVGFKKGRLMAIRDEIRDVALNLKPYGDCTRELLNRTQAKAKL